MATLDRLLSQGSSVAFHRPVSLGKRLGHVGVRDAFGPRDEPGDEVVGGAAATRGDASPAVQSAMQHRRHVLGIRQAPASNELGQGGFDVQAARFGVAEPSHERTVRFARPDRPEVRVAETGAREQGIEAVSLGGRGERQVLG